MELGLELRHGLALSPQLLQSMQMLQMDAQELSDFLAEAIDSNPLLERSEAEEARLREEFSAFVRTLPRHSGELSAFDVPAQSGCGLRTELLDQLPLSDSDISRCARFIIYNLDEDGYLDEDIMELALSHGVSEAAFQAALDTVQAMEPAGVGARSLSECLCLQLRRMGITGAALRIAGEFLPELGKSRLNSIAKKLGIGVKEVAEAADIIRSLSPRPGSGFNAPSAQYISPDIAVIRRGDDFAAVMNDGRFPSLSVNSGYARALKSDAEAEVRAYINEKLAQARWVVSGMEKRAATLRSCAMSIARRQREFFDRGPGHMAAMTLSDVAQDVGVHPSTVSRAIRGKFLQCRWGGIPMSVFFSRAVGGASAEKARTMIRSLISAEDKRRPLSDQKLCALLAAQGVDISRRTVAKYRQEMGIRPSPGRKEY